MISINMQNGKLMPERNRPIFVINGTPRHFANSVLGSLPGGLVSFYGSDSVVLGSLTSGLVSFYGSDKDGTVEIVGTILFSMRPSGRKIYYITSQ